MSMNATDVKGSFIKKKNFKPKHQKAKVFRASEPLLSVFMWGVNHTVTGLTHVNIPVMLMPDDFKAFSKIRVDNHYFNKENMPSHFKFKEYCPLVFRNLRVRFGIKETDYISSLTKSQPVPADSGTKISTKMYESYDRMFVVKSLVSEEVEFMHTLLKKYHPGTAIDREASTKEKVKELPTLKDGDFLQDGCKLHVGSQKREHILDMLTADVEFLSGLHLSEYSVCLGIHDFQTAEEGTEPSEEEPESEDSTAAVPTPPDSPCIILSSDMKQFSHPYAIDSSEDSPRRQVYFLALVDVLSHSKTRKRAATIGSVPPEQHARRLLDFLSKALL